MGADSLDVQPVVADHRFERVVGGFALRDVEFGVAQVTDARREAEAKQVHQRKNVIGEACRVGVVLLDAQIGFVVQQTVEHVGRVAHADVHDLGMKRRVLVGDVGIERPPWAAAVLRVDVPRALGLAAGSEITPSQHFSGRTLNDRNDTLWSSWVIQSGEQRIFYSGDSGYFSGFKQIGERFGGFDLALMENGAYNDYWPSVHMTPEQSVQAFTDLRGKVLYAVHNSTFDLAFHTWHDPLDRIADLSAAQQITLATPVIGEVLTIGQPRTNVRWWAGLR